MQTHTHLQVDAPGHDQRGQQQVGHGQRDDEVVGGGLQSALPRHSHAHQHVTEHHAEDQEHQQHRVEVIGRRGGGRGAGAVGGRERGRGGGGGGEGYGGVWRVMGDKDGEIVLKEGERGGGTGGVVWLVEWSHGLAPVDMVGLRINDTKERRQKIMTVWPSIQSFMIDLTKICLRLWQQRNEQRLLWHQGREFVFSLTLQRQINRTCTQTIPQLTYTHSQGHLLLSQPPTETDERSSSNLHGIFLASGAPNGCLKGKNSNSWRGNSCHCDCPVCTALTPKKVLTRHE